MNDFKLLTEPWWVNFFIAVPFVAYYFWRKRALDILKRTLILAACFGMAFGFVEASVVVYLRAAAGVFSGAANLSVGTYEQAGVLGELPGNLLSIEIFREAATLVMLSMVSILAAERPRERWALFLWMFAFWDIFYYIGLWGAIRWPQSLFTPDVLFLIPVPWLSQVWFPVLASVFSVCAVVLGRKK